MDWVIRLISEIRTVRAELNVPVAAKIPAILVGALAENRMRLDVHFDQITRLARLSQIEAASDNEAAVPQGAVQAVLDEASLVMPLAEIIDLDQEKARLEKEIGRLEGEIAGFDKKTRQREFYLQGAGGSG